MTPMMQQYRDAKAKHPGMLLFFRNGDFYELFEEDAELGAKILGITLTKRDKEIPMAGVPHHALDRYLTRLLQAGHRVAICEQLEDAAQAKGIIRREVTRVVTPGTLTEDALLNPQQSNHLAALWSGERAKGGPAGLAWVDVSTGQFFAADVPWDRLADEMGRLSVAECLCAESDLLARETPPADGGPAREAAIERGRIRARIRSLSPRPDWTFDPTSARAALHAHFAVRTLAGFGFDDASPCLVAAGALMLYLQETVKASLAHLGRLQPYRAECCLFLDDVTRRSLELTRTLRDNVREGSLLAALDRTATSMGARLLHDWIASPLREIPAIEGRLDAVEEFIAEHALRKDLRDLLGEGLDLQRLTSRVSTNRASPHDLAGVARTLRLLPKIKAKITGRRAPLLRELESRLELCPDLREALDASLVDEPPFSARDGGIFKPGYDAGLDELREAARGGKEWIARFQANEITRTGIPTLKVGFNHVHGYYIEITHAQSTKVPSDYRRKQTLKNAERYETPELKEYQEKVLTAEERATARELELFNALRERVAAQTPRILQTAEVLATVDVLAGLAELAASRQYCRPELCDEPILEITDGRHPVLDQTLPPGMFVPNDVSLSPQRGMFWLITGPNMSGKSTFIRQVAVLTLMAHIGSFVPARQAKVGITDRIFTRVGASDELSRGQSTFMVEMTEAANILNNATAKSLVILDEIGRGTSTYDGVSLAWAITEHLHNQTTCRGLFATHYHELAQLAESLPRLCNYNVQVREWEDQIVFLHKITPGSADKSYGIHVAQLAGVPDEVLERAKEVLTELEAHHRLHAQLKIRGKVTKPRAQRKPRAIPQPSLFAEAEPAVEE